jgi:addiction module RelB/DinJ family antitoxin
MILSLTEAKMAQTSLLQVRIDTELKKAAEELFADIGLDTSSVVRLFFKQAVARQEIPLPLTRPMENAESLHIAKSWDDPDSCLNNPIRVGEGYRKISREEIYDERINSLGCMKGKIQ